MFMTVFNVQFSHATIMVVGALSSINSMLNPIVYGYKIDPLKKELKKLFSCPCKTGNVIEE
jgi:hypothetical protein